MRPTLLSLCCLMLLGCADDLSDAAVVLDNYGALAEAEYADSVTVAEELDLAVEAFLDDPSPASLDAARQAWIASRDPYLQSEAFRYYGGPIEQGEPEHEGALNAWPIDESVVDYVVDSSNERLDTGLVNDPSVTLDEATLRAMNTAAGETAVTTGYHPVEFLLWGQDDPDLEGAGMRPHTDYVTDGTGDANADRRAAYLRLATDLIVDDLEQVHAEWVDEPDTFRREMVDGDPRAGLRDVLTGLAEMSGPELAGERIGVAVDTMDQEDEHSCFSDNTHREILQDAIGIRNVYLGRYERLDGTAVEGPGVSDLVAARDPELDDRMRAQLDATVEAARALEGPFDEMILSADGRSALTAVIDAAWSQTETLVEIAALFDITLNVE